MSLFGSGSDSLFGSADSGGMGTGGQGAQVSNSSIGQQNWMLPLFGQLFFAASALGVSLTDLFGDAITSGKAAKKQAGKDAKNGSFSLLPFGFGGKGEYLDFNKLMPKLPEIFNKLQTAQTDKFNTSFEKLGQVPATAQQYKIATGQISSLSPGQQTAINKMGEFALGAAAKTGLLNNSLIQAKALAPLAAQTASLEFGQQQSILAQMMGLAGAPAFAASGAGVMQAVPSAASFGPGIAQSAQNSGWLSAQNATNQLGASMFNVGAGQDLFGFLAAQTA